MHILKSAIVAHTGAAVTIHRVYAVQWANDQTVVTVNSFVDEETPGIAWQERYEIPGALPDMPTVTAWLTGPEGPLAGGSIIESVLTDLDVARRKAWDRIKAVRSAVEYGGAETSFGRVDTDQESRARLSGAVTAASIVLNNSPDEPWSIDWTMADNTASTFNAPQIVQLGLEVAAHVDAAHARARILRAAINAAETVDELHLIGWDSLTEDEPEPATP
ncbi:MULTISPECIES: DUF4376 domain-containing protein [unclassified Sphingobium]|uniref:DUF4376 domain-containing protein n=1 Tax=unclassified Sphingobium TaxID=2611147 RepID=UPI00222514E7|nr:MULTISPECIES: DUF4376 domain-containing protein [unclassified Sphingobium]MCW2395899.1 hypothetical protein [Sphingobium sp. B8D3B]MCW2419415.1 hypothetical protein [Sphingobium sp. B8D3C]